MFSLFKYDPEDSLNSKKYTYPIYKLKGLIGKKDLVEFKKWQEVFNNNF